MDLLLKQEDGATEVNDFVKAEGMAVNIITKPSINRATDVANRINADRDMAAMSLACHLYRFDKGNWPNSLEDLAAYLIVPIDPCGDGKQTLGYALIKGGLPDETDRPLVYSRFQMNDGLFFRVDRPEFSYYNDDGSDIPIEQQKHGGQFRDVASWVPGTGYHPLATTRPLG
jgi:hypothetical protein